MCQSSKHMQDGGWNLLIIDKLTKSNFERFLRELKFADMMSQFRAKS